MNKKEIKQWREIYKNDKDTNWFLWGLFIIFLFVDYWLIKHYQEINLMLIVVVVFISLILFLILVVGKDPSEMSDEEVEKIIQTQKRISRFKE